jgi:hypothetical protein
MQVSSLDFDVITGPSVPRDTRGVPQDSDRDPATDRSVALPSGSQPAAPRTR